MNLRLLSFAVVAVLAASGCTAAVDGSAAPVTPTTGPTAPAGTALPGESASRTEPPLFAPAVPDPKDARGVAACDLLTDDQLSELGLVPGSGQAATTAQTRRCSWSSAVDDTNPAVVDLLAETPTAPLDFLYRLRGTSEVWEELVITGHPAVRQDQYDDNSCSIYVAVSDHQAFGTDGNSARRDLPDPCALSRRMAELILSNLPPLR